ncbi:DUF3383 domain-containing protein [Acinetobacter baumannii]
MNKLPVSRVVNVDVYLSATAAATRGFGTPLFLGSSDVIDPNERMRAYSSATDVATDFGVDSAEYLTASAYFSQKPTPKSCYIGRWVKTASSGLLKGAILSTAQKALSNFTSISDGSFKITVDGIVKTVTAVDLTGVANLNGVASAINAKITGATFAWDAVYGRFTVTSATTGTTSTVGYASANTTGTDLSGLLGLNDGFASVPVPGQSAETIQEAVNDCIDLSNDWYGLALADSHPDDDIVAVAGIIESAYPVRIFGYTMQNSLALDPTSTTDLAARLKALHYDRTFLVYSSSSFYTAASVFGRMFTVNFTGTNTTITLKFKQLPGITEEGLRTSQANALQDKNCNVFAAYDNDTAILQEGTMVSGVFMDEMHGRDWMQNYVQTAVYNLPYTSNTKIPQTEAGVNKIVGTIEHALEQGVTNGFLAPGIWNGDEFGVLAAGDYLPKGYYVYANSINDQAQADREARKAPAIQCATKLAGAIHFSDISISVNR